MLLLLLRFDLVTAIHQLSVDTWTGDVIMICLFVCLFVCLWFFIPLENFSLIWRCHHRWTSANFDLFSALMAFEQWWFFGVPYLLWHGASVYNGHLRGAVTLTNCRTFRSGAVTIYFYDLLLSPLGFEHPYFRLLRELKFNQLPFSIGRSNKIAKIYFLQNHWARLVTENPGIRGI